jgi:hypothetical protein
VEAEAAEAAVPGKKEGGKRVNFDSFFFMDKNVGIYTLNIRRYGND